MPNDARRYSDREVSLIIKAALDLEMKEHRAGSGGLLLSEIEEIARETGISADHVRRAVDKILERRKGSAARLLFGSETSFERIEIVPQALTQDELERLDQSLPALTSLSESSVVNREALTWRRGIVKSILDGFPLTLKVRQAEKGTEVAAAAKLSSMATVLFAVSGGVGVLAGIKISLAAMLLIGIGGIGLPTSAALLSIGGLVGLGGSWLLARLAFRAFAKRSRAKVAAIVDRIKAAIREMRK